MAVAVWDDIVRVAVWTALDNCWRLVGCVAQLRLAVVKELPSM